MWLLKYGENSDFSRFSHCYGMNPKQKRQKRKQEKNKAAAKIQEGFRQLA